MVNLITRMARDCLETESGVILLWRFNCKVSPEIVWDFHGENIDSKSYYQTISILVFTIKSSIKSITFHTVPILYI